MNVPETMIEKACGTKDIRPQMQQPHLDVSTRRLIASNGYIAAILAVSLADNDCSGPVPIEAIKRARKSSGKFHVDAITLNGSAKLLDGTSIPRPEYIGQSDALTAALDKKIGPARTDAFDRPADLVIDAEYLLQLADALNNSGAKFKRGVQIWLPRDSEGKPDYRAPMYVRPTNGPDGAEGLIMPIGR